MGKNSILIAEDEGIIALDLKRILENSGFNFISFVRDGESLFKKILEETPSLIIMDINLRGKSNGIEIANKIWRNYYVPVIFISGMDEQFFNTKPDFTKCEFVKKPFGEDELIKAVIKFLSPA